jgi:hypothetical protein
MPPCPLQQLEPALQLRCSARVEINSSMRGDTAIQLQRTAGQRAYTHIPHTNARTWPARTFTVTIELTTLMSIKLGTSFDMRASSASDRSTSPTWRQQNMASARAHTHKHAHAKTHSLTRTFIRTTTNRNTHMPVTHAHIHIHNHTLPGTLQHMYMICCQGTDTASPASTISLANAAARSCACNAQTCETRPSNRRGRAAGSIQGRCFAERLRLVTAAAHAQTGGYMPRRCHHNAAHTAPRMPASKGTATRRPPSQVPRFRAQNDPACECTRTRTRTRTHDQIMRAHHHSTHARAAPCLSSIADGIEENAEGVVRGGDTASLHVVIHLSRTT